MLNVAQRLRSPGYSQRTGRKRKRRSMQPNRERQKVRGVFLTVISALAAVIIGLVTWRLSKGHAPIEKKSIPALPTSPIQSN